MSGRACALLTGTFLVAACGQPSDPNSMNGLAWLSAERVLVPGVGVTNKECRAAVCQHNENTDLTIYQGAIYFVHRTAISQVLGPNSSLRVLRSTDGGAHFDPVATI